MSSATRCFPALVSAFSLILFLSVLIGCGGTPKTAATGGVTPPSNPSPSPSPAPPPSSSCPTVTVAEAQGPTDGSTAPFPQPAPAPPSSPGPSSAGAVCVTTPTDGASVPSPTHVYAQTTLQNIDHMRIYIDGQAQYFTFFNTADALLWMSPGSHNLIVVATDKSGSDASTAFSVSVQGGDPAPVTDIQRMPNWEPCSAKFPPGHPRAGQECAAGKADAVSTMTENQSTPSLSGASAKFTMGGPVAYTNELYTKFLGGGANPSHFTYGMSFMIDQPDRPQALEFDVNQAFGNQRWVFGTECNFKGSGKWDVWDGVKGWQPTSAPCTAFPANTWIHLVWQFERVGNQVHYISVTVNDQTYPLDLFYSNEPYWTMESIDVAFQMDGNFAQQPYTVWLDNVTLTTK